MEATYKLVNRNAKKPNRVIRLAQLSNKEADLLNYAYSMNKSGLRWKKIPSSKNRWHEPQQHV
jgi:hypothetical protein